MIDRKKFRPMKNVLKVAAGVAAGLVLLLNLTSDRNRKTTVGRRRNMPMREIENNGGL